MFWRKASRQRLTIIDSKEKIMRKTVLILSLVAATWLAASNDAFAQRGILGGRGIGIGVGRYGGGNYGGYGRGYYGGGYYPGSYGTSYYGGGYGSGYYRGGYGSAYSPGYYGSNYYSNSYPAYSTPMYYSDPIVQTSGTDYRQSFYLEPNSSTLTVRVPNPDAEVWFDDTLTKQRGMERIFHTPALQQAGIYTIKARWTENGRTIEREQRVQVQPGQPATVEFRVSS